MIDLPETSSTGSLNHLPETSSTGSLCQLHRSVGHDRCKLSRTCERFPICDVKITENDRCVRPNKNVCVFPVTCS